MTILKQDVWPLDKKVGNKNKHGSQKMSFGFYENK